MVTDPEYDYSDMAMAHYLAARDREIYKLVVAARRAFDTFTLPEDEQKALDEALELFSNSVRYEDEPCKYCASGVYSGLPGGACENCMGTGLKYFVSLD